MFLRALALLSALAVPLLLTAPAVSGLHPAMFWIGPLVAIAAALPIVHAAKRARTQALFGAALAAMAAASTPGLPGLLRMTGSVDAMPAYDLRQAPLPATAAGHVAVQGYLQQDWVVDEYAVSDGARPDQNRAPEAVLLPLLGSDGDEAVTAIGAQTGRVVIVRLSPERVTSTLVTLRGSIEPVDPQIVESLFLVQYASEDGKLEAGPRASSSPPPAVLLDTFNVPTRAQALTRCALALGAALLALVLLLLAIPKQAVAKQADPAGA